MKMKLNLFEGFCTGEQPQFKEYLLFLTTIGDNVFGEYTCTGQLFSYSKLQLSLPAYFLMNGLLKLLVVKDCPNLPITVTCPVRSDYIHCRMTNIVPRKYGADQQV